MIKKISVGEIFKGMPSACGDLVGALLLLVVELYSVLSAREFSTHYPRLVCTTLSW